MGRRHRTAALLSLVLLIASCADEELPAPLPDGVFTLASGELDAWCESQGLGPSTPASRAPDATERERFGVGDDAPDEGLRRCRGSAPDDPRVQREVLVTGADGPQATVHLLVDVDPLR